MRFGNSLAVWSWRGEPAPNRVPPTVELDGPIIFVPPKTDFIEELTAGSMGDVLDVDDPDGGRVV